MATKISIPFKKNVVIEKESDFAKISFIFSGGGVVIDYTGTTFTGQVLDKVGGAKIYDFTFNTPGNDGLVSPTLTAAQTATLTDKVLHYWVKVDGLGYYSGEMKVGKNFVAGTV